MKIGDKAFKKLQKRWYQKLADDGFEEAEQLDGNLIKWHSFQFARQGNSTVPYAASKTEYYRLAGQFLHEHEFRNNWELRVWELHSDGKSMRTIAAILSKELRHTNKMQVNEKIKELSKEMMDKCRNRTD